MDRRNLVASFNVSVLGDNMGVYTKVHDDNVLDLTVWGTVYAQHRLQDIAYITFPGDRLKPNPLTATDGDINSIVVNHGKYYNPQTGFGGPVYWVYNGEQSPTKQTSSYNDALQKIAKVNGKFGNGAFNAGIFAAEFDQTAGMVSKRIFQLAEALKHLKNGNVKGLKEVLGIDLSRRQRAKMAYIAGTKGVKPGSGQYIQRSGQIANLWSEITYGWSPFVQDIYGALETFQKGLSSYGQEVSSQAGSLGTSNLSGEGALAAKANIRGRVINPTARNLQTLGLLNPASLVWEKLPFSFVFDWVFPIGDIFTSFTSDAGMAGLMTTFTYEVRTVTSYHGGAIPYSTQRQIARRVVLNNAWISADLESSSISGRRIANAVALLRQRFH